MGRISGRSALARRRRLLRRWRLLDAAHAARGAGAAPVILAACRVAVRRLILHHLSQRGLVLKVRPADVAAHAVGVAPRRAQHAAGPARAAVQLPILAAALDAARWRRSGLAQLFCRCEWGGEGEGLVHISAGTGQPRQRGAPLLHCGRVQGPCRRRHRSRYPIAIRSASPGRRRIWLGQRRQACRLASLFCSRCLHAVHLAARAALPGWRAARLEAACCWRWAGQPGVLCQPPTPAAWLGWAQKNTTEKAMNMQAIETQGLSRSPTRANFQNRPRNLRQRRAGWHGGGESCGPAKACSVAGGRQAAS